MFRTNHDRIEQAENMGKTKHSQFLLTASALAIGAAGIPAAAQQIIANGVTLQVPADTVIATKTAGPALTAYDHGTIEALGPLTITTTGTQANGAYAWNGTINLAGGTITTAGEHAVGLSSNTGTITSSGSLTIRTSGNFGAIGIGALSSTMTLDGAVDIATTGNRSMGLALATGSTGSSNGSLIIKTAGNDLAHGIALGASNITLDGAVDIATSGDTSSGLAANQSTVTSNGPLIIKTAGAESHGAFAVDGSTIEILSGDITTQGTAAAGIYSQFYRASRVNTVSIANGTLKSELGDLVRSDGGKLDVTLNAMTTGNGSGRVLNVLNDAAGNRGAVNLKAINTGLQGHVFAAAGNTANVSLVGSTLTGAADNATNLSLDAGSTWTMTEGSTVSDTVANAGTITFAPPGAGGFKTLTTRNYVGNQGSVALNTVLGADGSPSDRIVIDGGAATGRTGLVIHNLAGKGAPTTDGIKVVDAINDGMTNADAFFLGNGDYVTQDGQNAKVDGAYAYTLNRSPVSNGTDVYGDSQASNDWYLRSRYQPGVPAYESYPAALLILNRLPTLSQRTGDRYWRDQVQTACQDSASRSACAPSQGLTADDQDGTATMIRGNNVWARIEGLHGRQQPGNTTSRADHDYNLWKLQAGVDGQLYRSDAGKLIGGVTVHYGQVKTDISSTVGNGRIDTFGYGLGGTLTWYGANGFYLDAQGHVTQYESDLHSRTLGRSLAQGNDGSGHALSLEGGKRITLSEYWTLTPQAQLTWSSIDFDSFTDPYGARVSLDQGDSLKGRLGLALEHERSGKDANGKASRAKVYGIVNLTNEFLDGTRVDVSGTELSSRAETLAGAIGLGGAYSWANDKYTVYAEVAADTSLKNFADSYEVGGTFGLRVRF